MIHDFIEAALRRAHYELIDDDYPYYGTVPGLQGVWASGKSLDECRDNLADTVEGWVLIRLARGMAIPPLGEAAVVVPTELIIA